jgi:hypothetical protein
MQIHYKGNTFSLPYKTYDYPLREPDSPIFLRELSEELINCLVDSIYNNDIGQDQIQTILLPEQRYILRCHASYLHSYHFFATKHLFLTRMKQELFRLAEQEIEPGIFKDEDTLRTISGI